MSVPASHPRKVSLDLRDRIVEGVASGITSMHGLAAHGRGEAFDYMLGEATHDFARDAIRTATQLLRVARQPVISVNGNSAALVPEEMIELGNLSGAALEVNLFHESREREERIREHLLEKGATEVLLPEPECALDGTDSNRRFVSSRGIYGADVVFVPLEDGDRCEALRKHGKIVITVDLNPLSRTAKTATVTIVDNVARAMPCLLDEWSSGTNTTTRVEEILSRYSHEQVLKKAEERLRRGV